jgi:ferredoxin-NADP reductase
VVLISAGIGATPVLAMLTELAAQASQREVWWVHGARNGREHAFRAEVRQQVERLHNGHMHVRYSRPDRRDVIGRDFDAEARLDAASLIELGIPLDAEFRLCGPNPFVAEMKAGLDRAGVAAERIQSESFGGAPVAPPRAPVHPAAGPVVASAPGSGPSVGFQRSGLTATWEQGSTSLLDLAEANGVAAASGCRVGSCHSCRADVLDGTVRHDPEPLEPPAAGVALLCCAVPDGDVVLDA